MNVFMGACMRGGNRIIADVNATHLHVFMGVRECIIKDRGDIQFICMGACMHSGN